MRMIVVTDHTAAMWGIILIAIAYTLVSTWISKNIGKPKRIKEIQENFNRINKDLAKASKEKDQKALDDIIKRQEAAMPTMFEMMGLMYIPLIAIIPLLVFVANPQLNFNEVYLMTWPQDDGSAMQFNQTHIISTMGLPAGTEMSYSNGSVFFTSGGAQIAQLQKLSGIETAVFLHDGPAIHVQLRNESGKENAYFPTTRIYNPFAVSNVFKGFEIKLPIKLPVFIVNLFNIPLMFEDFNKYLNWRDTFGPYGFFWVCVIFAGLGISIINSIRDKYFGKKEGTPAATPGKP